MLGFLFILLLIFVLAQRKRYLMRYWYNRKDYWLGKGTDSGARHTGWYDKDKWYEHGAQAAERYAQRFERKAQRFERRLRRRIDREGHAWSWRYGTHPKPPWHPTSSGSQSRADSGGSSAGGEHTAFKTEEERAAYERARRRAAAEAGFYVHLMWYATVIGFLFLINLMTTGYPWFLWPALGWGFGLMSHFSAVFGWRWIQERVFQPAIQREVQREVQQEKEVLRTEKQASLDELTATFAHEIRNPIAAAKSLVQQMGEDPTSAENVEYAKVALDELARVERSVSHLLKYAKEEDYNFDNVNLASVLDAALTQMRAKLESKSVTVSRNYLSGPTVRADPDKLRQVFSNVIDNAIDAMESTTAERRIDLAIQTGEGFATVRIKDNGCGIAADKIGKIFNPFFTSKPNGTGLGMAVAKKIIEAHSGLIKVDSRLGAGTEFLFSIPLADGARSRPAGVSSVEGFGVPKGAGAPIANSPVGTTPATRDGAARDGNLSGPLPGAVGATAPIAAPAAGTAPMGPVKRQANDGVAKDGIKMDGAQSADGQRR
jgi:signal transduction histidine kinase